MFSRELEKKSSFFFFFNSLSVSLSVCQSVCLSLVVAELCKALIILLNSPLVAVLGSLSGEERRRTQVESRSIPLNIGLYFTAYSGYILQHTQMETHNYSTATSPPRSVPIISRHTRQMKSQNTRHHRTLQGTALPSFDSGVRYSCVRRM